MHIHCLGLNHHSAPIALRERLAFPSHTVERSLRQLRRGKTAQGTTPSELIILSTCNRVEIYAVTAMAGCRALKEFISDARGLPLAEFESALYHHLDEEAVTHLFRVAAGLDSQVLGEPQILGQISEAYSLAHRAGTAGKILSRLFHTAIHAGKRTRAETAIGQKPASIASVAVKLIADRVKDLARASVTVVGAGEMAELAVEALRKRGVDQILVVNRSLESARQLAGRWTGTADTLEALVQHLPQTDILITSTGAPHRIITPGLLQAGLQDRDHRPLVIMDIAVPRDVDERVAQIPGVHLYDIDALTDELEASLSNRAAEIPIVEGILEEVQSDFSDFLTTLKVVPVIAEMHKQADAIRRAELEKSIRRMADLCPEDHERIEKLTKAIVNKILHHPTMHLRDAVNGPDSSRVADVARLLFGIE